VNEPSKEDRLRALEERIAARKAKDAPRPHQEEHYSQAQLAWRMVIELVAGLGIGFGIGYGLDALFGTQPFLMVLFIFFGLAAGVKTMLRTAQEAQAKTEAQERADEMETRDSAKEMKDGD
jgi:ATP synthase protein I